MCGISGVFDPRGAIEQSLLEKMAATTRHRGPDHTGYYVSPDRRVGLAHNRLSIIDLSEAGNQPMVGADGKRWIVFNGEIYNFPELRSEMESRGCVFRSHSDTETLLELYGEKGEAALEELNGMFAFCIYDAEKRSLFLARDRVGIKPLYYTCRDGHFAFASEIKPLLKLPFVSKELDPLALDAYLTFRYIPEDLCIFRDIRKLRPAHCLRFSMVSGNVSVERYWNLTELTSDPVRVAEGEALDIFDEKLRDAVRLRMISDVPIGCFLSGGVDSSIVAALMARASNGPIKTFNISFDSEDRDESHYARIVSESIGSEHTERRMKMNAVSVLEKLIDNYDEPFADSSMIPTYYVSKVARESVTVVLSGDGGDELFGGYNWYDWPVRLGKLRRNLGPLARIVGTMGKSLPHWDTTWRRVLEGLSQDDAGQFLQRTSFFSQAEKQNICRLNPRQSGGEDFSHRFLEVFRGFDGDLVRRMTLTDFHMYLAEDILTKVDRASMAVSLEARVPWLDHRLVEFAFSLPSALRIKNGRKKHLPKELARKLLPKSLTIERKKGFCIPVNEWMRGELGTMLEAELHEETFADQFDSGFLLQLLSEHRENPRRKYGPKLFAILTLSLWLRRFLHE